MKINRTTGCFYQTIQVLNKRRLAGTGMTDNADKFTIFLKDERIESSGDATLQ